MPFKPGISGNAKGKPKGAKGVKTVQWEQLGNFITKAGAQKAMRILNSLPDEDYLDQYGKMLNYFKPRLASTQVQAKADININISAPGDDGNWLKDN